MDQSQPAVPKVVAWILFIHLITIGIYDFWAALYRGRNYTVSFALLSLVQSMPIVGILFGILIGHLFFPQGRLDDPGPPVEAIPVPIPEKLNEPPSKPAD